jgi:hypothetical protein
MPRLLFFLAIAFLVGLLVRTVTNRRPKERRGSVEEPPAEKLTQCAWCGAHVTGTSALVLPDGRTYCSVAHRDAAAATSSRDRS